MRCDATNTGSSMTTSLLPVPRRPETNQVSSIRTSPRGTSSRTGAGDSGTKAPSSSQWACSEPLEKPQRPDSIHPPSTGSTFAPPGLNADADHTSPRAKNSSAASSGASPTCQLWTDDTLNTQPVEPHAEAMGHATSKNA